MIATLAKVKKNLVPGTRFRSPKGVIGTVLGTKSERGKAQAKFSCSVKGCRRTHIREISDWFQCHRCRWHAKKRGDE